jgi:branched-subunit amino acid transport protein
VILGLLALITVVTRGFFFLSAIVRFPFPAWLRQGLRYAPLAAMAAVVVPEIVMQQGPADPHVPRHDARLYAALAAAGLYFWWRRGILGTIVTGMARAFCRCGWAWAGEPSLECGITLTSGPAS